MINKSIYHISSNEKQKQLFWLCLEYIFTFLTKDKVRRKEIERLMEGD